ncbi:kinase-like domain-containing protein [Stachybotrys elegans]|uniref:Kinase-like domain-containing protein n=1 Tax=Stachybotrys elegans TaxID=80388 RepID=A0A8K0SQS2_9HYPO|nr:kinase-like domain-containing protein [Stachybotrys elegans]
MEAASIRAIDQTTHFLDSFSSTAHKNIKLPSPADIRAINARSGHVKATNFNRPPPVQIRKLGLLVKYGGDVTTTEAETQRAVYHALKGRVPIPEVFGWVRDGGQTFIYMELIEGESLMARWTGLNETERLGVCRELRAMVASWRFMMKQDERDPYLGSIAKKPLNDILFRDRPHLQGPFFGHTAIADFHTVAGIDIQSSSIVFTHNDLVPPNILLSHGPNPRVVAIIDWGQSGWYPGYWEYCKARRVKVSNELMSDELQEEWEKKYLHQIIDREDDETCYYPWLYFFLSII